MAALALGVVAWGEDRYDLVVATTMGLTTLSLMHIVAALEAREPTGTIFSRYTIANRRFVQLIGAALVLTFLVTELGPLQRIFDTVSLTSSQWGICLLGPIVFLAVAELGKLVDRAHGTAASRRRSPRRDARRHRWTDERILEQLVVEPGTTAGPRRPRSRLDGRPGLRGALARRARGRGEGAVLARASRSSPTRRSCSGRATRYALLVVFQAMDAAGKDSAIEHVMSGVNPQGVQVVSFRKPSAEELDHDFLWRISRALPERGRIGIFNRSHYEEVVALRVHPEWLERSGCRRRRAAERFWEERYEDINAFERHLDRNGTKIVKFFLHVSKEEQKQRFLARLDTPGKEWKFNADDVDRARALGRLHGRLRRRAHRHVDRRGRRGTSSRPTTSGSRRRSSPRSSSTRSGRSTSAGPRCPRPSTRPTSRPARGSSRSRATSHRGTTGRAGAATTYALQRYSGVHT